MNQTFSHQHTAHCETGVMSSMLKHYGMNISEPMALGIAAGITFAYLPIVKLNGQPLIAYRMPPKSIIKGLQKRFGLKIRFEKFSNPEKGMQALDRQLDQSKIVGMQTSVYWLPYFPQDMRFHFNAHNLIVYGKDGDDYLISDPVFESKVRCNQADLQKARFTKGALAPKGMMYYLEEAPTEVNFNTVIPAAIRSSVRIMNTPFPLIGLHGIRTLAKKIRHASKKFNDEKDLALYLSHIVRMQEEIGTGGAGFRFIYASFLQEASKLINQPLLLEASELMTAAGDQWRQFAVETVMMCKQRKTMDLEQLSRTLLQCADEEKKVWRLLARVK